MTLTVKSALGVLPPLLVSLALTGGAPAAATAEGCHGDPRRGQLDFWVGEWRVVGEDGEVRGTHRVRRSEDGCVVEESWQSASGASGRSFSYFDPALGRWRQSRVDDRGRVTRYEGELRDGAMRFTGSRVDADGSARRARAVLAPGPGPSVEQRVELAGEAEIGWSLDFAGTWVPVGASPPAAEVTEAPASPPAEESRETASEPAATAESAAPVPAPAAAPRPAAVEPAAAAATEPAVGHGSVRPQTGMVTREGLARGEARIPMASPMVLRFPVGRVDRLSPGYAWRTTEVARYECEGTTIRGIRMTKGRPKGGRTPVEVTARLASARRAARVAVEVALYAGEERVAGATLPSVPVGMGLPAQIQDGAIEHTLVLELETGRLEELFGGTERPELEVTLTPLPRGE